MEKKKVVVGMSGGVDSSVAAFLLQEQGYEVIGVTMQIWQEEEADFVQENGGCCGLSAVEDARRVASSLGIPHYVMNFRREFQKQVIDYFVTEYSSGRTPNPCIACNRYVKWESLLHRSLEIGAAYIATGHYAKVMPLENGRFVLKKSAAWRKDQTYALYNLTQYQLSHTLMPLGDYSKEQIRALASEIGLRVATKPDSQEICFIPDQDYAGFIERESGGKIPPRGNFVTADGKVLGQHKGITHYTIGQRKGLNLALGRPVFVTEIRTNTNEVVIGENQDVYGDKLYANQLNFIGIDQFSKPMTVTAKIRYNDAGQACVVKQIAADQLECCFLKPVRAITPGQAVVFYQDDLVLGGGTIL
jgi:tRNA-specific 2-thiouridylase